VWLISIFLAGFAVFVGCDNFVDDFNVFYVCRCLL